MHPSRLPKYVFVISFDNLTGRNKLLQKTREILLNYKRVASSLLYVFVCSLKCSRAVISQNSACRCNNKIMTFLVFVATSFISRTANYLELCGFALLANYPAVNCTRRAFR